MGTIGVVSTASNSAWRVKLVSWAIRWDTQSPVNHAFIYAGEDRLLEARPGGSAFDDWDKYPGTVWLTKITPPARNFYQQEKVAFSLLHIPYNWIDLVAIGIAQKRWNDDIRNDWLAGKDVPWWVSRVSDDKRDICSQLCDVYYNQNGKHLFSDNRLPGLVSPGDLYALGQ